MTDNNLMTEAIKMVDKFTTVREDMESSRVTPGAGKKPLEVMI